MSTQVNPQLPDNFYEYVNDFDYSVWTPGTKVTVCNVPWDAEYRDVVNFKSEEDRDMYFTNQVQQGFSFELTGVVYLKYGEPIRLPQRFQDLNQYNYIIVQNPSQPVPSGGVGTGKPETFFYFIADVQYVAPNTTQLNVQLDVWQTYFDRVQFGNCYINKGHIGIANSNSQTNNLADYLTDPEGLNIGDEYETVSSFYVSFQHETPWVVVTTTTDFYNPWGDIEDPHLRTAPGGVYDGLPSGANSFAFDVKNFKELMSELSTHPWAAQGIQMIAIVPRAFCQVSDSELTIGNGVKAHALLEDPTVGLGTVGIVNWFDNFKLPERYKELLKFYTYPYSMVEMTAQSGGEIVLKNECLTSNNVKEFEVKTLCSPPHMRAVVYPKDYNSGGYDSSNSYDYYTPSGLKRRAKTPSGEGLDMGLVFDAFPQVSLVNDNAALYMAQTAHTRDYQFKSADWSQQKAMMAANTAYDNAGTAMNKELMNREAINAGQNQFNAIANEKVEWNAAQEFIPSAALAMGSAITGNAAGVASGVYNAGMALGNKILNQGWNDAANATRIATGNALTNNSYNAMSDIRDRNRDYAQAAAKGDYENAIQGIQAKVQDAQLIQPSVVGQNGGNAFNMCHGYTGILFKFKRIKPNFMRQVGDFWLRYGYYVNRWITPPKNLAVMDNFSYWKMQSSSVYGDMPEVFKQAIRGILEKGVTVWSDPNKINRIDLSDNRALEGISY